MPHLFLPAHTPTSIYPCHAPAAVSPASAFGGIGGTAAANTGFPAAKSGSRPSSRRQTT
ncbi:MAG: hypothetical protein JNJ78_15810 [Anaerolineae bacterium]|nr:hypothetical protein [Anaerolineae bacterium]